MSRLLLINGSPRGADSRSLRLAELFVEEYRRRAGHRVEVDRIDTFTDLVPFGQRHVDAKMALIEGRDIPSAARRDWDDVLGLAGRLTAADLWVFAVPMWNGTIPWPLKLFIDTVTQPGVAFRFDPQQGYRGLLEGRRAVAVYTSRVYAPGLPPAFGADHQSSYLSWWLRYCGVDDIHELRVRTARFDEQAARYAVEQLAERLR